MRQSLSQLSVAVIQDEDAFLGIEQEWNELFARIESPTPFQRFGWARLSWARNRPIPGRRLYVVVLRDEGRAALIAPFVADRRLGVFATLRFLDSLTPQFNDVMVADCAKAECYVGVLLAHLRRQWRVLGLRLPWMPESAVFARRRPSMPTITEHVMTAPFIDLRSYDGWKGYFNSLSSNLRRDHMRRLRLLEEKGGFEHSYADQEIAPGLLAWLFERKRDWVARRFPGSTWLSAPGTEELFTSAALEGLREGRTWLSAITVDDQPIAVALAFRERHTLFFSKSSYDPAWHFVSPSRTLRFLDIQHAFQADVQTIDLMIGGGFGKQRFADEARQIFSRKVRLPRVREWTRGNW